MTDKVFVVDTNVLVSAALSPYSTNADALKKALSLGKIVYSRATWTEFLEVLFRKKFDRYFTVAARRQIADRFIVHFENRETTEAIQACRDPNDDKYLELAVSAGASAIITGDKDLLILHPFRNISILSAADFLIQF